MTAHKHHDRDTAPSADAHALSIGSPGEVVIEHVRVRHRHHHSPQLSLNLTAMIDVVFLLLIYFLVATDFRLGEEIYRMDLPQRAGAAVGQRDPFELDVEPLRILVTSTGPMPAEYRLHIDGPYSQPADFEQLHHFLRQRQINQTNTSGLVLFEPDQPIIIQPTRGTRWDHAMEAFNAAARARYTNITFSRAD
jgi:biopolymer transport protein ExbD